MPASALRGADEAAIVLAFDAAGNSVNTAGVKRPAESAIGAGALALGIPPSHSTWSYSMSVDKQSAVIDAVIERLGAIADFGGLVFEGTTLASVDLESRDWPEHFLMVLPGATEELERAGSATVRERLTLTVHAFTRHASPARTLRQARLDIKRALSGSRASLGLLGIQSVSFQPETPVPAERGKSWACHVMPLQLTYMQSLGG